MTDALMQVRVIGSPAVLKQYPWLEGFAYAHPSQAPLAGIGDKLHLRKAEKQAFVRIVDRQFEIPPTLAMAVLQVELPK